MPIDMLTLAEGVTIDGRGALALVGINQRVIAPASLPVTLKQRLVMAISDELPDSAGGEFGQVPDGVVSLRVLDPSGIAIFATSEEVKLPGEKRWLDLPLLANIIMDIDIRVDSHGIYVVEVAHRPSSSEEMTWRLPLYIVSPQVALSPEKGSGRAFQLGEKIEVSSPSS